MDLSHNLPASLISPNLTSLPHIRHGFFTRCGGVSEGIYASLNCGPGSGDTIENVMENRLLVQKTIGASALLTCHQYHSAAVMTVKAPWPWQDAPKADAMVTKIPGIALGILTADCLPVLFADHAAGIIGAAHAGWKGALAGVLENTVVTMKRLGARDITAAIGPGISQKSYEVGPEFFERFATSVPQYFVPSSRPGHHCFDLKAYALSRLKALDIATHLLDRDTCLDEDTFFSYRRATLQGESAYGRQISVITLAPSPS